MYSMSTMHCNAGVGLANAFPMLLNIYFHPSSINEHQQWFRSHQPIMNNEVVSDFSVVEAQCCWWGVVISKKTFQHSGSPTERDLYAEVMGHLTTQLISFCLLEFPPCAALTLKGESILRLWSAPFITYRLPWFPNNTPCTVLQEHIDNVIWHMVGVARDRC